MKRIRTEDCDSEYPVRSSKIVLSEMNFASLSMRTSCFKSKSLHRAMTTAEDWSKFWVLFP